MNRCLFCHLILSLFITFGGISTSAEPIRQRLWPQGAPRAKGDTATDQPFFEIWQPNGPAQLRPAFVVCPGGGYGGLAVDHEGRQIAQWCNERGIMAFVLHYRLGSKGYHYPTQLIDVQRAMRWVRAHAADYKIDTHRIGVWGFSAGGHLASMAATLFEKDTEGVDDAIDQVSARPDIAVLCYPVISLNSTATHRGSRKNLLGPEDNDALAERLSTDRCVTSATPPSFLFQTNEDAAVPAENAVGFYMACRKHHVPAEFHVYESGRHGVGLASQDPRLSSWPDRLSDWLTFHGFIDGEASD